MPYQDPEIDSDKLAWLLSGGKPPMAAQVAPPGINAALLQPQMVPATALSKGAMSEGTGPYTLDNYAPAAPTLPPSNAPMPSLSSPLADTTRAVIAQRPQVPQPSADPYLSKINDLQTQISQSKPKFWERLLGAGVGFATAYGSHNPAEGAEIGARVTNRGRIGLQNQLAPLQEQEQQYQARTQRELQEKHQSFEDALRSVDEGRKQKDSEALEQERVAKAGRQDYLSMTPRERAAQVAELEQTSGMQFTPEEKSSFVLTGKVPAARGVKLSLAETMKQRDTEGRAAGLKGDDLMYYKLNGKLREPNPDVEARLAETKRAHSDAAADRDLRADELNFNKHQAASQRYNEKKKDIADRERTAFSQLEANSRYKTGDKIGAVIDEKTLANRKAELQKQFDAEYSALGPEPEQAPSRPARSAHTAKPDKQPAPPEKDEPYYPVIPQQPATQPAPAKAKVNVGDKVSVGGKTYTVKGFSPKSGKPIVGE